MSMTSLCPREVSRAKDSSLTRFPTRSTRRPAPIVWAVLLVACLPLAALASSSEDCVERCEGSVVLIQGALGSGTGFVVAPGWVATNRHVIEGELIESLQIRFPTPHKFPEGPYGCTLRYMSDQHDVAFLAIKAPHPPLPLTDADSLRRGQQVLTIGNPALGDQLLLNAIAAGVVSSEFVIEGRKHRQISMIIHPGYSGGPILDEPGNVVGMISCMAAAQPGIAFCIPADTLRSELARARTQTRDQTLQEASQYRLRVLADRYLASTSNLLTVCQKQILSRSLEDDECLADGPKLLAQAMSLSAGCAEALAVLAADECVPAEMKKSLQELAAIHDAAEEAANGPSGPLVLYTLYCRKLGEAFERVSKPLRDQL
jgi:S1-C subfamily serine protease